MKQLQAETNDKLKERKINRDSDGRIILNMDVINDDDFLSRFSLGEKPIISNDVADFLDSATSYYLPKEQYNLKINSNCIDENEKKIYPSAINEYYTRAYVDNERIIKRNFISSILLGIVGVILLAVMITLEIHNKSVIAIEIIDIAAWVFLWECFDIAFLENKVLKIKRMRYLAMQHMKVEFNPLSVDKKTSE